jgi:hypothetical protein
MSVPEKLQPCGSFFGLTGSPAFPATGVPYIFSSLPLSFDRQRHYFVKV